MILIKVASWIDNGKSFSNQSTAKLDQSTLQNIKITFKTPSFHLSFKQLAHLKKLKNELNECYSPFKPISSDNSMLSLLPLTVTMKCPF